MKYGFFLFFLGLVICLADCSSSLEDEMLLGGEGTIFDSSANAFGLQHAGLSEDDGLNFFTGNSLFNQSWVTAPASTEARDGLGPLFNARSCSSCHLKDGRGRPPAFKGEKGHGLLIRLAIDNDLIHGPIADKNYGTQLQDRSILGVNTEAAFDISHDTLTGTYPDGESYELIKPIYAFSELAEGDMEATEVSPRIANHIVGMGLLEAIPEATLLSLADEHDTDQDGISGRPNYVWDHTTSTSAIGRFGWKGNQPTVKQQVASAFAGDMGITSSIFPKSICPPSVICDDIPNGGEPEIPDENLDKVVLYTSSLAVPAMRDWEDKDVRKGRDLFSKVDCSSCHIPKVTTGTHPDFPAFSDQVIRPYTDLLLHDMGEGLADNADDFLATGREWRTPPLWGIGLFSIVNKHTFYLHDGRARNIEEAILWHGGEAESSKNKFMDLSSSQRKQLIKFLESL